MLIARQLGTICFLFFLINISFAQNLEGLGKQKPFSFSGSVTGRTIFYGAEGIENRRKPFSYLVTGSPTITLYNSLVIPFSFTYSEQDRSFRQPFNQFGMSPYYKWIKAHAGYRNLTFSQFTLAGHTFLGGGLELAPGILRFGFIYGRFLRATPADTSSRALQPYTYANWGYAMKVGVGKGSNFLDFSLLKAKDDSNSVRLDSRFRGLVTPAENAVVGINGQVQFLKKFVFGLETATSLYTHHIGMKAPIPEQLNDGVTSSLKGLLVTNSSTRRYNALQTSLSFQHKIVGVRLQYRRVDPDFRSMGAYFFNNDLENYTIAPSLALLQNKIRLSGSIGWQHDNLKKQKQSTSKRVIGSFNATYDINDRWGIDFNYYNYTNNQIRQTVLLGDSFRIAQVSQNFSLTPRYLLVGEKKVHSVVLSANYNVFSSVDKSIDNLDDTKSSNLFLNYQLTFVPTNLTLTINGNYTEVNSELYKQGNYGITLGANKVLLSGKLSLGWLGSFLQGLNSGSSGLLLNQNVTCNYKINKHHNIGANVNYINNKSVQTVYTPSYSEWRADLHYRYSF